MHENHILDRSERIQITYKVIAGMKYMFVLANGNACDKVQPRHHTCECMVAAGMNRPETNFSRILVRLHRMRENGTEFVETTR